MSLVKFNPRNASLNSIWDDFFHRDSFDSASPTIPAHNVPAVNIIENADSFQIEVAAPGYNKGDFKLDLDNHQLRLSVEKKDEKEENNSTYNLKEFSYSSFSRSFRLSKKVDSEKISAKYENGMLIIDLPKKEEAKVQPLRAIKIK